MTKDIWIKTIKEIEELNEILDYLTKQNITVSIAVGKNIYSNDVKISVQCLNGNTLEDFEKPFAANSYLHAANIAKLECKERGWVK